MKKYLKFAGFCAFVLVVVAFILIMATPALAYSNGDLSIKGLSVLFGGESNILGFQVKTLSLAPVALVGWILLIVSLVALLGGTALPIVNSKYAKLGGLANLCAGVLLVVAGVLLCFTKANLGAANSTDFTNWGLGAGWIVSIILVFLGGVLALLPAAVAFIGNRK